MLANPTALTIRSAPQELQAQEDTGVIFEKRSLRGSLWIAIIILITAAAAEAHHSFAMYDHTRP
jgi:hypothetical protein